MSRYALRALLAVAVAVPLVSTGAPPASAQITGRQSFHGLIVADGTHGERDIVRSPIVAKGIFDGVGRIVEVASRPGDPDNTDRDNLVFKVGTLHIISKSLKSTVSLDPKTCKLQVHVDQTGRVTGGTRAFRDAFGSFVSTVDATGRLARKANGDCNVRAVPLHERDVINSRGSLTY